MMSAQAPYILGVDIGTSSTKTIAVLHSGKVIAESRQAYPSQNPQPGRSEQNAPQLYEAAMQTVRDVIKQLGYPPAAVSFSAAMHSLMAVDASGTPLTPLIIWSDNRSEAYAADLRDTREGKAIFRETGTPVHPMSPLSKLMWMKQEAPAVFETAHKFIGIKEYILFQLCGVYITDYAIASATGLFNIREKKWSQTALKHAGVTADRLPEIVPSTHILPPVHAALLEANGLSTQTIFVAGASDGCLAQLGSGAVNPGEAAITIGTSGAIRTVTGNPQADETGRLFTYVLEDRYVAGGAINNGGVAVQWLGNLLTPGKFSAPQFTEDAFRVAPGCEGLLCLPYLQGERAPVWDSRASGTFANVRQHHTPAHFQRALIEGISFSLYSIVEALFTVTGPIKQVSVSGGFTASEQWIQLLADVFQLPMLLEKENDASALGAALLGWHALKELDMWSYSPPPGTKVFNPDGQHHQLYMRNYRAFGMLYAQMKEIGRVLR
ncbi:gluconokinase [Chitinophaga horti]|uniref:Gluconokinase n=1 Tax=Chitinophaga horti TaxID=2920382 RepID=A0ABY6IZT5_9BACT|nr:gluconokinase [Chitinophaga horti]UYQ92928.1 gluconokinase [Chitinophaga horti]